MARLISRKSKKSTHGKHGASNRKSNTSDRGAHMIHKIPSTRIAPQNQKLKEKKKHKVASENMALSSLQIMARSHGIAFGGLSKSQLVRKINGVKA